MELKTYLQIINRRKKIIIGIFGILMVLIITVGQTLPRKYSATTNIRVIPPKIGGTNYVGFDLYYASRLMNTYVSLIFSNSVENELMKRLNISELPDIKADVIADSELIRISVLHTDPELSAEITNTIADILVARNNEAAIDTSGVAEILYNDRIEVITAELENVRTEYENLAVPYNQNSNYISALSRQIDYDQRLYNILKDRYEVNLQLLDPNKAKLLSLSGQLSTIKQKVEAELETLDEMNMQAAQDAVDIEFALAQMAQKEREYTSLVSEYNQLQAIQAFQDTNQLIVVDRAVPAEKPSSPNLTWVYGIGTVFSLFTALIIAFFIDNLDDRVFSTPQIEAVARIPVLGTVSPNFHSDHAMVLNGEFNDSEDIRRLHLNLHRLSKENPLSTMIISSTEPRNGTLPLSTKLAAEYAKADINTIIIDANIRHPSLHRHFSRLTNENGLTEVISGKINLEKVIKNSGMPNLFVMPAGEIQKNPGLTLGSEKMKEMLIELKSMFKMVVIDIAPILYVSDSDELLTYVDGVVLIVERGQSCSSDIQSAVKHLNGLSAPLIGCVVNHAEINRKTKSYQKKIWREAKK
ncbi:MAG: polysaccharide biosynthesis tyrosine autokinase [Anaerolineaceae bacterium]|nr:polysaccharide biosynthesis tyrosine autokinase [Anaerolineaceae bacterium]